MGWSEWPSDWYSKHPQGVFGAWRVVPAHEGGSIAAMTATKGKEAIYARLRLQADIEWHFLSTPLGRACDNPLFSPCFQPNFCLWSNASPARRLRSRNSRTLFNLNQHHRWSEVSLKKLLNHVIKRLIAYLMIAQAYGQKMHWQKWKIKKKAKVRLGEKGWPKIYHFCLDSAQAVKFNIYVPSDKATWG